MKTKLASWTQMSAKYIIMTAAIFLGMTLLLNNLPAGSRNTLLPIILLAVFIRAAFKSPPVAILILLYYSMIEGGWYILAAAPITMLLARRYQRQRLEHELTPVHIRRTVLIALSAMAATLPFIAASLGAWSARNQSSPRNSASPLVTRPQPGEEGLLRRLADWLGLGPNGDPVNPAGPLQPSPVQPVRPDEPFNWWLVVGVVAVIVLLLAAWWLWRQIQRGTEVGHDQYVATPLARLEAVGERIGRPRAPHEGAITYGRVLAAQTGDERLANVGPLVSGQVYQSAFAQPREVGANLATIEAAPPPLPPPPSLGQRLAAKRDKLPSNQALGAGLLAALALAIAGWILVPRLGELRQPNRFEQGLESPSIVHIEAQPVEPV